MDLGIVGDPFVDILHAGVHQHALKVYEST